MRKFLLIAFFSLVFSLGLLSCGLHSLITDDLSDSKIVEALQEALFLGSKTAAVNLGDASCSASMQEAKACATGYLGNKLVEIVLPENVKNALENIEPFTNAINTLPLPARNLLSEAMNMPLNALSGLDKYGDSIKIALNRGAEKAAPNSIAIFENAIFGMSFSDAREILFGDSVAATTYLYGATHSSLQSNFAPFIKDPLDLLNPNKYWEPIASKCNSFTSAYSEVKNSINSSLALKPLQLALGGSTLPNLPENLLDLPPDISTYLSEYATGKALDGLFYMVGVQESKLREDPWGTVRAATGFITDAVGDLLGDVFSKAKGG
jgi:hypothetical protein